MRKIKEVLRLAGMPGLSERQIARSANMRKTTVHDYQLRAGNAGITSSDAQLMTDDKLDALFFPLVTAPVERKQPLPDFANVHKAL